MVNNTPSTVEKTVARKVGKIISVGLALCMATRTATREEGKICKDVALSTKNIAEEYSALSVWSRSCAALMPYGVAAPEMPSRLTDKFILKQSSVSWLSVLKILRDNGLTALDIACVRPESFHTFISPSHTA